MGSSEGKLLLIGLDNSGKTTILSRIIDPQTLNTDITPTIGYKKSKFSRNGIDFEVFDMSGQSKYRDLWQSNAKTSSNMIDGIIFVADSSDKMRLNVARSELQLILQNQEIPKNIPFLFYSNKNDIKGSCSVDEVAEILNLKEIGRTYKIFACSGLSGRGVEEGINWLTLGLKSKIENR